MADDDLREVLADSHHVGGQEQVLADALSAVLDLADEGLATSTRIMDDGYPSLIVRDNDDVRDAIHVVIREALGVSDDHA